MSLSTLSVVVALTTESSLVDFAVGSTRERHSVVLQLDDGLWSFASHVMDGILVSEPIGALDCVVHVPLPVVVLHVAESGIDATLSGYGVGAGREQLCDDSSLESLSDQTERGSQAGTTLKNGN